MSRTRDRLSSMAAGPTAVLAEPKPTLVAGKPPVAERRRALVVAPPPVPGSAYVTLLESEGYDVMLSPDVVMAESLLRSARPELIVTVGPELAGDVRDRWSELAPGAELRSIPGLKRVLQERLVPPSQLVEFTLGSLTTIAGLLSSLKGRSQGEIGRIAHLTGEAAQALRRSPREILTARLAAVLSGCAELIALEPALDADTDATLALDRRDWRQRLARLAEATSCPLAVAAEPPPGPAAERPPVPLELVDAAARFVTASDAGDADVALTLRLLSIDGEVVAELHPAAVEAVLAAGGVTGHKRTRGSVLLVDPDGSTASLLALRLGNEGYAVRSAADGRRALEEFKRERPTVVLTETVLPGLDGFALLDQIKREAKGEVPVIFLSSRADPMSVNKGLLLGAADYLQKDLDFSILLTKLQRTLSEQVGVDEAATRLSLADVTQASSAPSAPMQSIAYDELGVGVEILSRFRIDADLGEGGMGKVFKATDQRLEEPVVIKVMKPGVSEEVVARFKREIRLARRITHPSVVRIFDFWEAGDVCFVTMEFLAGRDLFAELQERGALALAEALQIGEQLFDGLAAAHDVGVLHRDIKPHNVLLLPSGSIKVLDFGIAQGLEPSPGEALTVAGFVLGTPEYMSPEQLMNETLDARSDLYSAGIMLFELLTGTRPQQAKDRTGVLRQRMTIEADLASSRNPRISPDVDALVGRLLRRDRNERYASAEAVVAEIRTLRARHG